MSGERVQFHKTTYIMLKTIPFFRAASVILILMLGFSYAHAQGYQNYDDGFRVGASVNYGGIYYASEGDFLNDIWSNSLGYQVHVLYGFRLSSLFSLSTGATLFANRYGFKEQKNAVIGDFGEPTGGYIVSSMTGSAGTTYVGLPVNFIVRPLGNKSLYVLAGTEISYKITHSNGTIKTTLVEGDDEHILFDERYDIPERSHDTMLFLNLGIGYSFGPASLPLNIEFGARQALTPFMSGENFINSWIRTFSLSASYGF